MSFTLRTSLAIITIISLWLGALISQNPVLLECVTGLSLLLIFLSLPLAIWDSNQARRPFWAGFFAVGFGNLLLMVNAFDYNESSALVASLISPAQAAQPVGYSAVYASPYPSPQPAWQPIPPQQAGQVLPATFVPLAATSVLPSYQYIHSSFPAAITLFVAMLGGMITSRLSRNAKNDESLAANDEVDRSIGDTDVDIHE